MRLNKVINIDVTDSCHLFTVAPGAFASARWSVDQAARGWLLQGSSGLVSRGRAWALGASLPSRCSGSRFAGTAGPSCHWCVPSSAGTHWALDMHPPQGPHLAPGDPLPRHCAGVPPLEALALQQQVLGHRCFRFSYRVASALLTNCSEKRGHGEVRRGQEPFPQHLPLRCHLPAPSPPVPTVPTSVPRAEVQAFHTSCGPETIGQGALMGSDESRHESWTDRDI